MIHLYVACGSKSVHVSHVQVLHRAQSYLVPGIQGAPHACRLSSADMLREGVKGLMGCEGG